MALPRSSSTAIKRRLIFRLLESKTLAFFRRDRKAMASLVDNAALPDPRTKVVHRMMEFEEIRKLLNFESHMGHAIEICTSCHMEKAVAISMSSWSV